MPMIDDAEGIVREYYRNPLGPRPYDFDTYKRGYTWIVRFSIQTISRVEDHEWHISADTGDVIRRG
jgi:hypothetical protein